LGLDPLANICSMGEAGTKPLFDLDYALEKGNLSSAWFAATEAGYVKLEQALKLTMLMGINESPGYDRAARKFLVRFIREVEPTMEQVRKVAHALEELHWVNEIVYTRGEGPEWALKDLARQIEERGRPAALERKKPPGSGGRGACT
jgi:hypothetical protein